MSAEEARKNARRRRLGWWDAQDRMMKLNSIYRLMPFGDDRSRLTKQAHAELDDVSSPEPDEELADSELSDAERRSAIARERWRREGRS